MGSDSAKQSFILSSPILQALVCPALPGVGLGVLFPSAKPILETKKICFVFLNDNFQSRQINPSDVWNPTPLGCAITHIGGVDDGHYSQKLNVPSFWNRDSFLSWFISENRNDHSQCEQL